MENLVFTQLSIPDIRRIFTEQLSAYFATHPQAKPQASTDQVFDIDEAARYCKFSKPTMYALVSKGEIPHSKRGKRLYFLESELMNWIKEGRKRTNAELAHEAERIVATKKKGGYRA
jgi:excisionase family DNA binding protein